MGIFKRLFRVEKEPPKDQISAAGAALDEERVSRMFERSPSFSMVAILGDVESDIPRFLSACGYKCLRTGGFTGSFDEVYAGIGQPYGPDNSLVQKAWFKAAGHTILLDPEMVLVTEAARLAEMARTANGTVKVAIWERVSESVALVEIGTQGILRQTWYCEGEQSDEPINEHPEIVAQPNSEGLKKALATYGLPEDAIFGYVEASVVELQG